MSSIKLNKQLVLLDFKNDNYQFVNIKVVAFGYNDLRVVIREGRLGNKGSERSSKFVGNDSFKNAMRRAYGEKKKFQDKGYLNQSRVIESLEKLEEDLERVRTNEKKNKKGVNCDFCGKYINQINSEKIKRWAETEGNWNYSKDSPLYKKMVCIDCQIEKEIFQTRIDESFTLEE